MSDSIERTRKLKKMPVSTMTIPMVCAWCGKLYRLEKWEVESDRRVSTSHGICPECSKRQTDSLRQNSSDS